ncbi:hypothetical protein K504DRAFT_237310 [Pleomassaria siparia CBS 279.74]|uniref:Uncharacterized protein n=1 Tax=Pleomassaria siparia CBS 279.74 TaxID=1314801 RepID=A0A6G1KDL7_9PLEO|nr:hypothetical protein K504DRAFT_237310 [Pleomassaria siparia CBS 279.74]
MGSTKEKGPRAAGMAVKHNALVMCIHNQQMLLSPCTARQLSHPPLLYHQPTSRLRDCVVHLETPASRTTPDPLGLGPHATAPGQQRETGEREAPGTGSIVVLIVDSDSDSDCGWSHCQPNTHLNFRSSFSSSTSGTQESPEFSGICIAALLPRAQRTDPDLVSTFVIHTCSSSSSSSSSNHLIPHASRLTPHASHLTPHTSHLTPHTPRISHLASHKPDLSLEPVCSPTQTTPSAQPLVKSLRRIHSFHTSSLPPLLCIPLVHWSIESHPDAFPARRATPPLRV